VNKIIRLALLLGLALLASWSSTPKPAYALGSCRGLNGGFCTTPGHAIPCLTGSGTGVCVCQDNKTLDCS
jgi:hypothetical protein